LPDTKSHSAKMANIHTRATKLPDFEAIQKQI